MLLTRQQKTGIQSTPSRAFLALLHHSWNSPRLWPPSSGRAAETQPGKSWLLACMRSCCWPPNTLFFPYKEDHLRLQNTAISWKVPVFQKPAAFSADSLWVCDSMVNGAIVNSGFCMEKGEVNLTDTVKGESLDLCKSARKWGWWRQGYLKLGRRGRWVWGFLHTYRFLASLQVLCGRLITSLTSGCLSPI